MGDLHYLRGPGAKGTTRHHKTAPAPAPPPVPGPPPAQEPTVLTSTAAGRPLILNPNLCGICHKAKHRNTRHHEFEPDTAWPDIAKLLGWPEPPTQESLI